jgi:presenilin-like A22 family membrane protease
MNTSQKFAVQIATVGGLLGGMIIALAVTKDFNKAKTYGLVLGTVGAIAGYSFAKKATDPKA